jgi:hypothetical protein
MMTKSLHSVRNKFHFPILGDLKKYIIYVWCVFFKPCMKLTLHCNHRYGHLKTEHTGSLLLLRRHLRNWSCGRAVSMRSELIVAHEKRGLLPLLTGYVVPS